MATKAATAAETTETREEAAEGPLLDAIAATIKKMVARGKERGYVTYDELNAALPQDQVSAEQIEDTMTMLSELGINVIESEEGEEPAAAEAEGGDDDNEARASGNLDDEDIGRTDDPVRMYLREMGSVELLSREGEIAIAKRIEAGRDMMIGGICESPLTIRAIVGWRDALVEGKMLLRDIIDLDATYGSNVFAQPTDAGEGGVAPEPAADAAPAVVNGAEGDGEVPAEIAGEMAAEEGEGEESSISLAAMEAALKPQVLETFDLIAQSYKKLHKLQEQRLGAMQKGEPLPKATEKRYDKLKAEMVETMEGVRLNNARIESLVEQLYDLNRRLMGVEGRLLRLAEVVQRQAPGLPQELFRQRAVAELAREDARASGPRLGEPDLAPCRRGRRAALARSRRSPAKAACRSASSAASSARCSAASARPRGRRRRWSRPIFASSSRSRRNTPIAACNSSTSSRRGISAS